MSKESKQYTVVDYPSEAYINSPLPLPPSANLGVIDPKNAFLSPIGYLCYFPGLKYPMKGLRRGDKIFASDAVKKYIKSDLSFYSCNPVRYFFGFIFFLPPFLFKKVANKWLSLFSDFCISQTERHWLDEKYYSVPVREILRVGLKLFGGTRMGEVIVRTICFILEQDLPYAWRLQDIFQLIEKANVEKNPAKEFKRLVDIFSQRDHQRHWKAMGYLIWVLLLIRPEIRNTFKKFALELDVQKMWFDESDLFFNLKNDEKQEVGYDYLGLDKEKRFKLWDNINNGTLKELQI